MKIYFSGSMRGGREDVEIYAHVIALLKTYGVVLTEHIGNPNLEGNSNISDQQIYARDTEWLASADILIAEVTNPSLGVGYELGYAECHGKDIVCLYRVNTARRLSAMIAGNPKVRIFNYTHVAELVRVFDALLRP